MRAGGLEVYCQRMAEHRAQMFGTHCAVCHTEFTDADRPVYDGPFAAVAATGLTMTCAPCREYAAVKRETLDRHANALALLAGSVRRAFIRKAR